MNYASSGIKPTMRKHEDSNEKFRHFLPEVTIVPGFPSGKNITNARKEVALTYFLEHDMIECSIRI